MAYPNETFIIIDYNDEVIFLYSNDNERHFLKYKTIEEVEKFWKNSEKHNSPFKMTKKDDHNLSSIFNYFSKYWSIYDRNIFRFDVNSKKWTTMIYSGGNSVFGSI